MKQIDIIHISPSPVYERSAGDILEKMQGVIYAEGRLLTITDPHQKQQMLKFSAILFGTIISLVAIAQLF